MNIRPFAVEVLRELHNYYELIIFTASHKSYANSILSVLLQHDPCLVDHIFYREHCVLINNKIHVKSLSIFADRCLENIILVDNNLYTFAYDINNGLPIIPFYD